METQIQFQANLCGICGQQGGIGVGFVIFLLSPLFHQY